MSPRRLLVLSSKSVALTISSAVTLALVSVWPPDSRALLLPFIPFNACHALLIP